MSRGRREGRVRVFGLIETKRLDYTENKCIDLPI